MDQPVVPGYVCLHDVILVCFLFIVNEKCKEEPLVTSDTALFYLKKILETP